MYRTLSDAHTITHVHLGQKPPSLPSTTSSLSSRSEFTSDSGSEAEADCASGAGPQLTTRIAGTASESEVVIGLRFVSTTEANDCFFRQ